MAAKSSIFQYIGICIAVFCLWSPLSAAHDSQDWRTACEEALAAIPVEQKDQLTEQIVDVSIGYGFWGRFQRLSLQRQFFQTLSEIGRATHGLLYEEIKRKAQKTFDEMPVGPGAPANIRSEIAQGRILDQVFVVTHQNKGLQSRTAALLEERRFANVPRVFLVSGNFFSARRSYADQASIFLFSDGGELTVPLIGKTIYLAGGYSSLCLSRTVGALIRQAESLGMAELQFHIFPDLVYYADSKFDLRSQMGHDALPTLVRNTILRDSGGADLLRSSGSDKNWSGDFQLPSGLLVRIHLERKR